MADAIEPPDLQHRIRAFKTDISIPLDDDLAKGRGGDSDGGAEFEDPIAERRRITLALCPARTEVSSSSKREKRDAFQLVRSACHRGTPEK